MSNFSNMLDTQNHEFRVVIGRTKLDYDQRKEQKNRREHHYSLESAVHLLERLVLPISNAPPHVVSDSFVEKGEVRHRHMSVDDSGKVVFMVTTMRENETVRAISFRRASGPERAQFKEMTGYVEA